MISGFAEFEFDLPEALLTSLISVFNQLAGAPLTTANVNSVPETQGVYFLLLGDKVTYIGKTDAEAGLRKRLQRHAFTIQHRQGLSAEDVSFKAVRIFVFTAMDLETQLIRRYAPVPWNNSGFGSNDPGRNRDATELKPAGFDAQFPINLEHPIALQISAPATIAAILAEMRRALPYTFRTELFSRGTASPHASLLATVVNPLPDPPHTTRKLVESVVHALPAGWQATALAGRIILYREHREYVHGTIITRS